MYIDETTYIETVRAFISRLLEIRQERRFDAIVAMKRSGLFLGVWASHALGLPLFVTSEFRGKPMDKFRNILVVDSAVCTGKTLRKAARQLQPRKVFTAAIWREGDGGCDFVLQSTKSQHLLKFFYEGPLKTS